MTYDEAKTIIHSWTVHKKAYRQEAARIVLDTPNAPESDTKQAWFLLGGKPPSPERIAAERQTIVRVAAMHSAEAVSRVIPFAGRGFSHRTIDALVAHGIDAPERLLFITEADLKKTPGIGKASFEEIMRYRHRTTV